MFRRVVLRGAVVALVLLSPVGALTALADDGRPPADPAGRPPSPVAIPRSELRPSALQPVPSARPATAVDAATPAKELVIFIGGYGSEASDGTFAQLTTEFPADRYDVVRFGADPRFTYDSYDAIERSAAALIDEIRTIGPRYTSVSIVTHSMGGVVADRAFELGLSARDGVSTEVAIASPHSGSLFARVPTLVFPLIGGVKDIVRDSSMLVEGPDPESRAARDLSSARPVAAPRGIVRLDVSLATDGLVNQNDARDPGVTQRVFLPASLTQALDGHGGSLVNRDVIHLVGQTIRDHSIPPARRDAATAVLAPIVWPIAGEVWRRLIIGCVVVVVCLALVRWLPHVHPVFERAIRWCRADLKRRGR